LDRIQQAIVTEGKFDKVKLSSLFDTVIIETGGFGVFKNEEIRELIRRFARTTGIVILTDSDPAGRKIRSYINSFVKEGTVLNAYVPAVDGKERRKNKPGAAGILGVEGLDDKVIKEAVLSVTETSDRVPDGDPVTAAELYEYGLVGRKDSSSLRESFLLKIGLPPGLSRKQMLSYLNSVPGPQGFRKMLMEFMDENAEQK
jgi:ribonuclease M5